MDDTEGLVDAYLRSCGYSDIVYEPDGNVPPDFLVDGRIAVEVRRLNQQFDDGTGLKGLEEVTIPLWKMLEAMAREMGPADGRSWYVSITYRRPLPDRKVLRKMLTEAFERVLNEDVKTSIEFRLSPRMKVLFTRASKPRPFAFTLGGRVDQQSGGFLLAEVLENLRRCLDEKAAKIAKVKNKYPEWWLVLPDHIGRGLDLDEQEFLRGEVPRHQAFERVVLIDPSNPSSGFAVY